MFYFDALFGKTILRSDCLEGVNHFFTTRDGFDFDKIGAKRLITPNQTHSSNVLVVDDKTEYPETDGLIISNPGDAVYLRFADCTPLMFYDTQKHVGAVSHAGWRGTADKIGVITVKKMPESFGSNPQDIIALIGPAISICCYEVGEDVKEKLLSTVSDTTGLFYGNKDQKD